MIVPNDTPASPAKSNHHLENPPAYQYQGYSTVPSGSRVPTSSLLATSTTPIFTKDSRSRPRRVACKRFAKGFFIAALIYLVCVTYFKSFISWGYWGKVDPEWPGYTTGSGTWNMGKNGCSVSWDNSGDNSLDFLNINEVNNTNLVDLPFKVDFVAPYQAHTSVTLPPNAIKHLIVGNRAYGTIVFETSSDVEDVKVDVTAYYHRQHVFDLVRVCRLDGDTGGKGVGIYLPPHFGHWQREDQISFKILVTFPTHAIAAFSEENQFTVNDFESRFSNSNYFFNELRNSVFFRRLKVKGSNAGVTANSLNIEQGIIQSSNGGIAGKFYVNDSLVLETSNGKVDVDLEIEDAEHHPNGVLTKLKTSNGYIQVDANLHIRQQNGSIRAEGGSFKLDTQTSNSRITLNVPTIPFNSNLWLTAKTSNSPVSVYLDERGSFEGKYKADTSSYMGRPIVERADENDERDGKHRVLETTSFGRGSSVGKVYWGEWGHGRDGNVELRTSNAKAYLSI